MTIKFSTTLKSEQLSRTCFRLLDDLVYGDLVVPKGFYTNYASIEILHNVFLYPLYALFAGYGNYASTLHDWLYSTRQFSRKECDRIFYHALRSEGVARWRAALFWLGVRVGGRRAYTGG